MLKLKKLSKDEYTEVLSFMLKTNKSKKSDKNKMKDIKPHKDK